MNASQIGETYSVELDARDRTSARNAWMSAIEIHPLIDKYKTLLQSEATLSFVDRLLGLGGSVDLTIIPDDYASVYCLVPAYKLTRLDQCQLYLDFHQLSHRAPDLEETYSYSKVADKSLARRVGVASGEEVIALVLHLTDEGTTNWEQILGFSRHFLDESQVKQLAAAWFIPGQMSDEEVARISELIPRLYPEQVWGAKEQPQGILVAPITQAKKGLSFADHTPTGYPVAVKLSRARSDSLHR